MNNFLHLFRFAITITIKQRNGWKSSDLSRAWKPYFFLLLLGELENVVRSTRTQLYWVQQRSNSKLEQICLYGYSFEPIERYNVKRQHGHHWIISSGGHIQNRFLWFCHHARFNRHWHQWSGDGRYKWRWLGCTVARFRSGESIDANVICISYCFYFFFVSFSHFFMQNFDVPL